MQAFKKKDKWIIDANSVASWKMVEFLHVRRWKKRNRTEFYWVVEQVCVGSIQYRGIETFWDRKLCMNFLVWFFGQNILNQFSIKIIHKDLI